MSEQEAKCRTRIAFAGAIVAGQLSILLPGPAMDPLLYGLSCLIVLGIVVAGALPSVRASGPAQLWLALAYVGVIVLLRQAAEGPTGGFAPLVILPALWLALYGSRRQLLIDLAVTFVALALPWALIGGDQYPASTPRSALLVLAVAAIAGLSIQRLLAQVRASRDRLSGVLAAATGNAIIATDREGTITVFNPGAERMLGYRAEEVVGGATPALFLTDDIEPTFEAFAMALAASGGGETRELTYVRKDGTRLRVSQTLTTERGPDGRVVGYLGVATDVTQQLRAQSALVAERDFTSAVLDTAGSLVIVTDRQARIERFNRAAEEVTGFAAREMIGKSLIETLMPPESVERRAGRARRGGRDGVPSALRARAADRGRRPPAGVVVRGLPHRRRGRDHAPRGHRHRRHRDAARGRRAADLHRLAGGHPRAHHDAHHGQGRRGALPAGQPGVARGERRHRPDRQHGRRAVRARGRRARAPDRQGRVEHRPPGRVRAYAGRLDCARREVPPPRPTRGRSTPSARSRPTSPSATARSPRRGRRPRRSRTSWPT